MRRRGGKARGLERKVHHGVLIRMVMVAAEKPAEKGKAREARWDSTTNRALFLPRDGTRPKRIGSALRAEDLATPPGANVTSVLPSDLLIDCIEERLTRP